MLLTSQTKLGGAISRRQGLVRKIRSTFPLLLALPFIGLEGLVAADKLSNSNGGITPANVPVATQTYLGSVAADGPGLDPGSDPGEEPGVDPGEEPVAEADVRLTIEYQGTDDPDVLVISGSVEGTNATVFLTGVIELEIEVDANGNFEVTALFNSGVVEAIAVDEDNQSSEVEALFIF